MIDIVPNWHPVSVHFPIALVAVSTVLYVLAIAFKRFGAGELLIVSKWCLWLAGLSAIGTATFGWLAYNSVAHDAPSHAAMTLHKDWAIPTASFIFGCAIFAFYIRKDWGKKYILVTLILLLSASGLTAVTGWLGAEAVYRYGIGVMRIPNADEHSHSKPHEEGPESEDASQNTLDKEEHGEGHSH
jgi:uncharacterized membrane protein